MASNIDNDEHQELVNYLTEELTLSIEEVADWHFLDLALHVDRNRPLVRLLVDLVGPKPAPVVDLRDSSIGALHGPVLVAV